VTLTKREKTIALGTGGVLLAFVCVMFLILPYFDKRAKLNNDIARAAQQQKHDNDLLANVPRVDAQWKQLTARVLQTQPAQATGNAGDALNDWAKWARLNIQSLNPDHPVQKGDFLLVHFKLSAVGNTGSLTNFLWALETTDLPLQIDELGVTARKEGANDLNVQMGVTTAVFSPSTTTRPGSRQAPKGGDTL
jgi:hypothetical protein